MRIVLDTNILARAASGPPSPAAELVQWVLEKDYTLIVSPFLLSELSRVMRYESVRRIHGKSDQEIDQFLCNIQLASIVVEPESNAISLVSSDPDDDPIIATAVVFKADILCTLDRHLHTQDVVDYCHSHGIEIIGDVDLLKRWKAQHADS